VGLRQRLAAGDSDIAGAIAGDTFDDGGEGQALTAAEGVLGVAITAAQRTTSEAHEYRRQSQRTGLALQRVKNLGDAQRLVHEWQCRKRSGSGSGRRLALA